MVHRSTTCLSVFLLALSLLVGCGTTRDASTGSQSSKPAELRPEDWSAQGATLKEKGFPAQALAAFNRAIEENPKLTEAYLGIGSIYRERALYDQADQAYRRAVISDPNNFDARYYLGLTNQLQGKLTQAVASYQRALRINPNSFEANRDMGTAVLQMGRPDEAIAFAKRAVELNPASQSCWANLAAAYSVAGDYKKAVDAYRQTMELGDAEVPVLIGLANAHIKLGNYQRAENVLRAIEREGGDPLARERLGHVLFKLGKYEESSASYKLALTQMPNDTASLNGLGVCLMAIYLRDGGEDEKQRMEALSLWRKSLSLNEDQNVLIDLISRYTKE